MGISRIWIGDGDGDGDGDGEMASGDSYYADQSPSMAIGIQHSRSLAKLR